MYAGWCVAMVGGSEGGGQPETKYHSDSYLGLRFRNAAEASGPSQRLFQGLSECHIADACFRARNWTSSP